MKQKRPIFKDRLYVGKPNIGNKKKLITRINDMLDRYLLTNNGVYVQEFEKKIADFVSAKHCIAVCNATIGLQIAIRALNLKGEVIIPSFTFVATAHALQWEEITPVFCDIEPETFNIDPKKIEALITPKTSGIIGVHLWGRACNIDVLKEIADKNSLKLLFDAAHAFGCSYRGMKIGGFGNAEIFSFHATKILNTFEGGAIITNDDELAAKIRLMKNFGFSGYDNVIYLGTNGKMNEAAAAMGLTGLESLKTFIAHNKKNYQAYRKELENIPGLRMMNYDEKEECNYHYIVVHVDPIHFGLYRDELVDLLHTQNIYARKYFYPGCHNMEPYKSFSTKQSLPITEQIAKNIVVLPTGTTINISHIKKICIFLRQISLRKKFIR